MEKNSQNASGESRKSRPTSHDRNPRCDSTNRNDNETKTISERGSVLPPEQNPMLTRMRRNSANQDDTGAKAPECVSEAGRLSQIQEYIKQTNAILETLRGSPHQRHMAQFEKLSAMVADLRDSESKLQAIVCNLDETNNKSGGREEATEVRPPPSRSVPASASATNGEGTPSDAQRTLELLNQGDPMAALEAVRQLAEDTYARELSVESNADAQIVGIQGRVDRLASLHTNRSDLVYLLGEQDSHLNAEFLQVQSRLHDLQAQRESIKFLIDGTGTRPQRADMSDDDTESSETASPVPTDHGSDEDTDREVVADERSSLAPNRFQTTDPQHEDTESYTGDNSMDLLSAKNTGTIPKCDNVETNRVNSNLTLALLQETISAVASRRTAGQPIPENLLCMLNVLDGPPSQGRSHSPSAIGNRSRSQSSLPHSCGASSNPTPVTGTSNPTCQQPRSTPGNVASLYEPTVSAGERRADVAHAHTVDELQGMTERLTRQTLDMREHAATLASATEEVRRLKAELLLRKKANVQGVGRQVLSELRARKGELEGLIENIAAPINVSQELGTPVAAVQLQAQTESNFGHDNRRWADDRAGSSTDDFETRLQESFAALKCHGNGASVSPRASSNARPYAVEVAANHKNAKLVAQEQRQRQQMHLDAWSDDIVDVTVNSKGPGFTRQPEQARRRRSHSRRQQEANAATGRVAPVGRVLPELVESASVPQVPARQMQMPPLVRISRRERQCGSAYVPPVSHTSAGQVPPQLRDPQVAAGRVRATSSPQSCSPEVIAVPAEVYAELLRENATLRFQNITYRDILDRYESQRLSNAESMLQVMNTRTEAILQLVQESAVNRMQPPPYEAEVPLSAANHSNQMRDSCSNSGHSNQPPPRRLSGCNRCGDADCDSPCGGAHLWNQLPATTLNNLVPPGNRSNNYLDNFRR